MSHLALRFVSPMTGLTPNEKLVLFQLATAHNSATGQCNQSPETLAAFTGMTAYQIRRSITELVKKQTLRISNKNIEFVGLEASPEMIPNDWFPSDSIIQKIAETFPKHDMNLGDFVDDFITFSNQNNLAIRPEERDGAFFRNIAHLLALRASGKVEIHVTDTRRQTSSVRDFLAGLDTV